MVVGQITDSEIRLLRFKTLLNYTSCLIYASLLRVSFLSFVIYKMEIAASAPKDA